MLHNLCSKKINLVNVEKEVSCPILLKGTDPQMLLLDTVVINLCHPHSSVLLEGSVDFSILDSSHGEILGPFLIQIVRNIDGKPKVIYETGFEQTGINYLANVMHLSTLSFHWFDFMPLYTNSCCCCCPLPYPIKYTFQIATDGLGTETQEAGLIKGDIYSLNAIEI